MNDDDLSDVVPSAKFWQQFPDGHVPIKHTEHLFWSDNNIDDLAQALVDTATLYDEARARLGKIDPVEVEVLLKEYRLLRQEGADSSFTEFVPWVGKGTKRRQGSRNKDELQQLRIDVLRKLVRAGLKLRPMMKVIDRWVLDQAYRGFKGVPEDTLYALDEAILEPTPYHIVAKKFGVSVAATRTWSQARYDHEVVYDEAVALWPTTERKADMLRELEAKYPYMHLDYSTVYKRYKEQLNAR